MFHPALDTANLHEDFLKTEPPFFCHTFIIIIIIIYPSTARVVGAPGDFVTSFLHFSMFSTALWDLLNSRPVHSLMLSSTFNVIQTIFIVLFSTDSTANSQHPRTWHPRGRLVLC